MSFITGELEVEEAEEDDGTGKSNKGSRGDARIQVILRPTNRAIRTPLPITTHFFDFTAINKSLI
jgi:hypothetical protein